MGALPFGPQLLTTSLNYGVIGHNHSYIITRLPVILPARQPLTLTVAPAELRWCPECPLALSSGLPVPHSSPVFASQPCCVKPSQTQSLPGAQRFGPAAPVQL